VSSGVIAALVALGLGVMLVRRRSLATLLVSAQALVLGIGALSLAGDGSGLAVAGVILVVRALALPAILALATRRTREPALVAPPRSAVVRLLLATVVALVAAVAVPPLGLADRAAEQGALALLCLGIAIVIMRRPAILQVLGIIVAENGVYLLAVSVPGGIPAVVELGVLFDLVLVVTVAAAFSEKIHEALGSGDTDLLRGLRD
jgi:hydrogenase-4 component E